MAVTSIAIIDAIFSDINAVVPNFTSLVSSYRLLVGAAEEIQRTPGVPFEIFERAVIRYDRAGTLIDILLELLCCKIAFSSQFLAVTCAPVDIFRLLFLNTCVDDDPSRTAEEIIVLELLRQALGRNCVDRGCFGPPPEGITPPHPPTPPPKSPDSSPKPPDPPPKPTAPPAPFLIQSDFEPTAELQTEISQLGSITSPLTRRHI